MVYFTSTYIGYFGGNWYLRFCMYHLQFIQLLIGLGKISNILLFLLQAITRIFYEFKDLFPDDLTQLLIDNMCLLMTSTSREVTGAALSFLKV